MKIHRAWIALFLLPGVLLFVFVYALSLGILFVTSFCDWSIGSPITFLGLQNYADLFSSPKFGSAVWNTLRWILLQCTIHVSIGVLFALIVSQGKWYAKIVRTGFMFPNIISNAALGMLFLCVLNPKFGPVNSIIRMLGAKNFSHNWFMNPKTAFFAVTMTWLPFAAVIAILVLAEMAAIDSSIYEAAAIDGATRFQINIYVTLPMMRNAIGTGTILAATSMLKHLDLILMTTNGGPGDKTLNMPMLIYETSMRSNHFSLANAQGVVLILIGLVVIGVINRIYRMNETD